MKSPGKLLITSALVALCVIWGTTWAVIQIGLEGIPPMSGVALRFAIASALLLAAAYVMGVRLGRTRREKALWLINAALSFSISYGVVYWCEQWVPSGLTAVLFATNPLFVAVFAHFLLPSESLNRAEVTGILVGFAGVALIFSEDFRALGGDQVALAAAVMLVSPLAAAMGSVAVKRWGKGVHPVSLSSVPMAITAGVLGALAITFEGNQSISWDTTSIAALLYLAIFGSVITFTLYFWLLERLPAKRLALIAYVIPLVAVGIGAIRGEPMTARILAGATLVVAGTALAVHRFSRQAQPNGQRSIPSSSYPNSGFSSS
jgi:drug/metabolite transporter (DMT)-like permease